MGPTGYFRFQRSGQSWSNFFLFTHGASLGLCTFVSEKNEDMKGKKLLLLIPRFHMKMSVCCLLLLIMLMIQPGMAIIFSQDGRDIPGAHLIEAMNNASNISRTPFPIQFFYNTHCGACHASVKYLQNFTIAHPDVAVEYHDLFNNTRSFALYEDYKKQFNRTDLHYPVIFMGNVGIMESDDIEAYTELLTVWYQKHTTSNPVSGLFSWLLSLMNTKK